MKPKPSLLPPRPARPKQPPPSPTRTPRPPLVPTLIRFVILAGGVVGVIYAAMYLLVDSVQVQPREMSEIVEIPKAPK